MIGKGLIKRGQSAVVEVEPTTLLQVIQNASMNPEVDIEKMERLMAMHERLVDKQNETAFHAAMTEAQKQTRRIAADLENKQTHSRYASYAALDKVLRPIYTEHGFALSFDTGDAPDEYVRVLCYVSHSGGHSKTYKVDMPADGKGAKGGDVMTKTHAVGSGMSYGMRYLLKMIFNVAIGDDDDDGNAAGYPTITQSQVADLEALIDEVGSDKSAFMRYCKVTSFDQILARNYKFAVEALEQKRKG